MGQKNEAGRDATTLSRLPVGEGNSQWLYSQWQAQIACKECGRQFVEKPQQKRISAQTKGLVDKLLLERVSLAGIVRVTGVSARWLQDYVNRKYAAQPQQVDIPTPKNGA